MSNFDLTKLLAKMEKMSKFDLTKLLVRGFWHKLTMDKQLDFHKPVNTLRSDGEFSNITNMEW